MFRRKKSIMKLMILSFLFLVFTEDLIESITYSVEFCKFSFIV